MPNLSNFSEYIPVKNGFIVNCLEDDSNTIYGLEINDDTIVKVIDNHSLNSWLNSSGSNFNLSKENKLFRNGVEWSAKVNKSISRPIARLRSGHVVHVKQTTMNYFQEKFIITRPDGTIEMELLIPWSPSDSGENSTGKSFYSWNFGNYGELYALIHPSLDKCKYDFPNFDEGEAELVVVRNHLKYFGILTDDRIRLRKEASTSSESLGTYPKNTGFYIIERGTKEETIGTDKGIWYHVRLLDGTEGWFFGAYVRDLYEGPGTPLPWPNVADWD